MVLRSNSQTVPGSVSLKVATINFVSSFVARSEIDLAVAELFFDLVVIGFETSYPSSRYEFCRPRRWLRLARSSGPRIRHCRNRRFPSDRFRLFGFSCRIQQIELDQVEIAFVRLHIDALVVLMKPIGPQIQRRCTNRSFVALPSAPKFSISVSPFCGERVARRSLSGVVEN